jgi:hypothetical protein
MNLSEQDFERQLRSAPKPRPPAGLRQQLIDQVRLAEASSPIARRGAPGWFHRWWPALAPAAVSAACAVVLTFQQLELRDLKESMRALSPPSETANTPVIQAVGSTPQAAPAVAPAPGPEEELSRLRETAQQLRAEVAQLEQLRAENGKLRAQLAVPQPGMFTPEEQQALAQAREKAQSIQCVNNLKQIGLAARIWALDNRDVYPSDFLSMSNELTTPKILVCPADTNRPAATDWASCSSASYSYEYLAPNGSSDDPLRVLTRCPIHGNIGLCDGSVQMGVAKNHPDWVIQRNGKVYYEDAAHTLRLTK